MTPGVGTAIVSYIEPEPGYRKEFNRWYERDHFVTTVRAGPGVFAGGRFVATRACKDARSGTLWGDLRPGTYLSIAWVLPGRQEAWDAWVAREMDVIAAEDRLFAHRQHVHTAVYRFVRATGAVPAMFAFDRAPAGVLAVADVNADDVDVPNAVAVVRLRSERTIISAVDPPPHDLLLAFADHDPLTLRAFPRRELGYVSPFISTVPGTDDYTEEDA